MSWPHAEWAGRRGYHALAKAHRDLDVAVLAAYGWSTSVLGAPEKLIPRLMDRNASIANRSVSSRPFPSSAGTSPSAVQGSLGV